MESKPGGRDRGRVNEGFMEIMLFFPTTAHMHLFLELKICHFPHVVNCINYLSMRSGPVAEK